MCFDHLSKTAKEVARHLLGVSELISARIEGNALTYNKNHGELKDKNYSPMPQATMTFI